MGEYKDSFVETDRLKIHALGDGYVMFEINRQNVVLDVITFRELVKELNTITWVVNG